MLKIHRELLKECGYEGVIPCVLIPILVPIYRRNVQKTDTELRWKYFTFKRWGYSITRSVLYTEIKRLGEKFRS